MSDRGNFEQDVVPGRVNEDNQTGMDRERNEREGLLDRLLEQRRKKNSEPIPLGVRSGYGLPLCLGLREVGFRDGRAGMNGAFIFGIFEDRLGIDSQDRYKPVGYMVVERGPLYLECRSADAMKDEYGGDIHNMKFPTKVEDKYFTPLSHASNSENGIEVGIGQTYRSIREKHLDKLGLTSQFADNRRVSDDSPYGRRGVGSILVDFATQLAEREHLDVFFYKCTRDSINLLTAIKDRGEHKVKIEKIPGERYTHAWIYAWSK